jgi:cellulose synthase/poly-beta-1,6-N-acetylglucosamine synthase-like glycosyltransferase
LAGRLAKGKSLSNHKPPGRFAVLIPAYKEDGIIVDTAKHALAQNYPSDKMEIVVIADSLKQETMDELAKLPIRVVKAELAVSRKASSINLALKQIPEVFDYILVLDADNVMGKDCLLKMNDELSKGAVAVQGQRTAKNTDHPIALLESISELINNHIFRRGHRALGFSPTLIGSGMAFRYGYFRHLMDGISSIWEDRDLVIKLFKENNTIAYVQDAIIYDEKVSSYKVLKNQRAKWLAGQIDSIKRIGDYWNNGSLNRNLANMFLHSIAPPRSFVFIFLGLMFIFTLFFSNLLWFFVLLLGTFIITISMAVPLRMFNAKLLKASLLLPKVLFVMFGSLIQSIVKQDNNYHTPHNYKKKQTTL